MKNNLEDILREALKERLNNGQSVLELAKLSDLDWGQIRRFADGQAELRTSGAARLAIVLGLELRPIKRRGNSSQTS